jgi:hypothetical protein
MDAAAERASIFVSASEAAHLEAMHEEVCTALTQLRLNLHLARAGLPRSEAGPQAGVGEHLDEADEAVERLARFAHRLRAWRAGQP